MASKENWAADYVECFEGQPEGWPLYPAIKSTALKPGMCGYFDIDGVWQTIVDLTNPEDVRLKNLPPVHGVNYSGGNLASTSAWGVRKSTHVKQKDITAAVRARVEGAPAGGGITYEYSAMSDKGALLVTRGPIAYAQATPNKDLCDWVVENGQEILRRVRRPKRGVWIVTKTYSSKHRRISVLSTKGSSVNVGIDVTALQNTAEARASAGFWDQDAHEFWNNDHDNDGIVLAMCGIQWKDRWYSSKAHPIEERKRQTLDGDSGDIVLRPFDIQISAVEGEELDDDDDDAVRIEPVIWGDVDGVQVGIEEEYEG